MQLDSTHITVTALRKLISRANVAGGSFAGWLPHPSIVDPTERETTFQSAKGPAVQQCVSDLLKAAGLAPDLNISTGDGGERVWPAQWVGSLSDKGTVVLGALAATSSYAAIGIDLERIDGGERDLNQSVIAPEGIPGVTDPQIGTLLSFSAKEAVFKAQFPQTRQRIGFSEIQLTWTLPENEHFRAAALIPDGRIFEVSSVIVSPWVVCASVSFR